MTSLTPRVLSVALLTPALAAASPLDLSFDAGVDDWRVVLDGVMGGRSTGRIDQPEPGLLRFSGVLSLENNGGFSQIRTTVEQGSLAGGRGLELRVRGDGRTYQCDLRTSDVRLMAGGFQATFETTGEWQTVRIPFDSVRLFNFGRPVRNAPDFKPELVESIGVTLADKKAGPFELLFGSIRAYGGAADDGPRGSDLAAVAKRAGLTTLLALVEAAGLDLPAGGGVTILAPSNDAFDGLDDALRARLLAPEGRAALRQVLEHHVVPEVLSATALLRRRSVTPVSGQDLPVNDGQLAVGPARLLAVDAAFDGGVVHVIDRVLVPEQRSISERLADDEQLSALYGALVAAGLEEQLGPGNTGPWTLLAPSDDAFAEIAPGRLSSWLEDPERLTAILAAHVIPGRIGRVDMLGQRTARTLLGGDPVTFELAGDRITAGGAALVAIDLPASNGVIHVIDRVLVPDAPGGAPARDDDAVRRILALLEAAIAQGVPLFNGGDPRACAAVYEVTVMAILELAPDAIGPVTRLRLDRALDEARATHDRRSAAWTLRRAMDRAYAELSQRAAALAAR